MKDEHSEYKQQEHLYCLASVANKHHTMRMQAAKINDIISMNGSDQKAELKIASHRKDPLGSSLPRSK